MSQFIKFAFINAMSMVLDTFSDSYQISNRTDSLIDKI